MPGRPFGVGCAGRLAICFPLSQATVCCPHLLNRDPEKNPIIWERNIFRFVQKESKGTEKRLAVLAPEALWILAGSGTAGMRAGQTRALKGRRTTFTTTKFQRLSGTRIDFALVPGDFITG